MGVVVKHKIQEYMNQGDTKQVARTKAHEYCLKTNTCRGCSSAVRRWSWKQGYCTECIEEPMQY